MSQNQIVSTVSIRAPRLHSRRLILLAVSLVSAIAIGGAVYAGEVQRDSDHDGLTDVVERTGWQVAGGIIYVTDPLKDDTDGDGLTDHDEAGEPTRTSGGTTMYVGLSDPTRADSDADGLDDLIETRGWESADGEQFRTGPMLADSDGDGLLDGDEAGVLVSETAGHYSFALYSIPTVADSDDDGLTDAAEADESLDPFKPDTDEDGLPDLIELDLIGTAGNAADTDGDGLSDMIEVLDADGRGLNPRHPDVRTDPNELALEAAQGFFAGEAAPGSTVAWLSGNLLSGGASLIPGVGWIVGGVADARDFIASSIRADWVSAGFSITGMIPVTGDAVAVPLKITRFLVKHPKLVNEVCIMVARLDWLEEGSRAQIVASAAPEAWDKLRDSASAKTLLGLLNGGMKLQDLAEAMAKANHIEGPSAPFMNSLTSAEDALADIVDERADTEIVRDRGLSTASCGSDCTPKVRVVDVLVDSTAHEAKVGYTSLTESVERQIRSDAHLISSGEIDAAHWHFFASARDNSIGASSDVLALLHEFGIDYTIHLPG